MLIFWGKLLKKRSFNSYSQNDIHLDSIYMELFRFNRLKSSAKCVIIVTIQKGKGSAGWFPAEKGNKKMEYKIALIPGDGIGPEIVREARKVLDAVCSKYGHKFIYSEVGLLAIRKALNLFANLRPAYLYQELKAACPLKEEVIGEGFDMIIVRELTGGLYFGERKTVEENGIKTAVDTLSYNENEIRRIAVKAFDIAMKRKKKVTSVDKANVLDSSRLWRKVVEEVAKDYPEVTLEHMLVDNCAMQLVHNPGQFDVILTENMFGDILSDEASMVTGSIGMLSSASLNDTKFGLYEPSHGSAPDIAGQNKANPIATILSAAMMLRYSLDLDREADAVEAAVQKVLKDGCRTGDIMSEGCRPVGTAEMGDLIAAAV